MSIRAGTRTDFAAAVLLALMACASACGPSAPTAPDAPAQVRATVLPTPVPAEVQNVAGSSLARYHVSFDVTFRAPAGFGGRVTEITVALLNNDAQGKSANVVVDVPLPSGGTATHAIDQTLEVPGAQAPFHLQVGATGLDSAGKPFTVPSLQIPLTIVGSATGGPFNHVFVVVEENTNYDDVIGNPQMPYLNSLAAQYALATQYYANTHPSIGNYFMLTVGNIVTNSDGYSGIVPDDNIVRQLTAAGRTWKSYAEDLPSVGYTGGDVGRYARRHNPFALLADVVRNPSQVTNLVPFSQFAIDLGSSAFPNYSFIVPNLCNDGHDCPLGTVDSWLQANIGPLVGNSQFQRDGLLIVTFDEASDQDATNGGGRVVWLAVSGRSKRGYRSSTVYQHQSTLRLTAQVLGLTSFPNQAAVAPEMNEFFIY